VTRIAIIGSGIAGLSCAYFLHPRFDITLFDSNAHVGGHSNTVTVWEHGREVAIDTGFMVYNEVTYPNLTRLFKELNAPVKKTSMSFSVQHASTGLEYCGTSMNHLFAQRRNLLRPRFWRMLRQIDRFNREAVEALADPATFSQSLGDYVEQRGYGKDFFDLFLVPMSSAVWSTPPEKMLRFPASTLLRFFHNHGFLGLHAQHQWWTVDGGARSYVSLMTESFRERIQLGRGVVEVAERLDGVVVATCDGEIQMFDKVILACHGDQALRLLADPDETQRRLLGSFKYEPNVATLHTDASVMPATRRAWASWNYRIDGTADGQQLASTIYWMNSLQGVSDQENYFVSVNGQADIREDRILKQIDYEHPLFDLAAIKAQKELPELNRRSPGQRIYFCGSYFKYGFHEDAFSSGLEVSRILLGERIWA
jgi:predicted NAD/FAD-binding protein